MVFYHSLQSSRDSVQMGFIFMLLHCDKHLRLESQCGMDRSANRRQTNLSGQYLTLNIAPDQLSNGSLNVMNFKTESYIRF